MKESDIKYFLYVGNAYPHKNLERVIKVASHSKVQFFIVSSRNIFTKRLEKIIQKLHAENYVKLLGFVPDEKLKSLYESSSGFMFPSLSEGFGLPGLEAMKNGTLVLCSNIPVFKEIYGNHPIYFDPTNLQSIQKAMQDVLNMKESERRKRISEARQFVKIYSWQKMAQETLDVYNSVK